MMCDEVSFDFHIVSRQHLLIEVRKPSKHLTDHSMSSELTISEATFQALLVVSSEDMF